MQWINRFQLFLFDFDGILVNTEPLHYAAYEKACLKWDFPWTFSYEQYCKEAHGQEQGIRKAIYRQWPELQDKGPSWDVIAAEKKQIYMEWLDTYPVVLMPGVESFLDKLQDKKRPSCVVTNSSRVPVERIKRSIQALQSIPYWITREDYQHPKPSPESYLKAIERYASVKKGLESQVIGFEDTLKGFKALSQTPARAVLICPAHREHISACLALGGQHFESFEALSDEAFIL